MAFPTLSRTAAGRIVSLLLLLLSFPLLQAAPLYETGSRNTLSDNYNVTFLTTAEGLPGNIVDDILIDSRGFLWAALSGGGLVRYDGYGFDNINTTSAPLSIKGNFVYNIAEDAFRRLWIVSDGGLDILSLDTFENITDKVVAGLSLPIVSGPVPAYMIIDGKGRVWMTGGGRIVCFAPSSDGTLADFWEMKVDPVRYSPLVVGDINGEGEVWTSVAGRICRLVPGSGHSIEAAAVADGLTVGRDCYVGAYREKDGMVWMACEDGLLCYNPVSGAVRRYVSNPADPHSLSQNFSTSLEVLPDNTLLVGTLRGLNLYDPVTDSFTRISASDGGLNCDFVNGMRYGAGCLWVGTEGGGINVFSPRRLRSQLVAGYPDASSHPVNSIFIDENDRLWYGTVEGGLHVTDERTHEIRHYTTDGSPLSHNSVSAIVSDGKGGLWVGTWGGGLTRLDIDNPTRLLDGPYNLASGQMATDFIGALAFDPYNQLVWVGGSKGVYHVSVASGEIREAYPESWKDADGSIGAVVTRNGELWIGSIGGLIVFDLKKGFDTSGQIPHRVIAGEGKPRRVTYIVESHADGNLYVATNGNGLYRCHSDSSGETFENITASTPLSLTIAGLAFDSGDNLWIATNSGIGCLRPDGSLLRFRVINGLGNSHFYWNASQTLPGGDILFGTTAGLLRISAPHRTPAFLPEPYGNGAGTPEVVFTRMLVDHEPVTIASGTVSADISTSPKIKVHQSVKALGFEFSSLDYSGGFSGRYEYRLSGFEKEWVPLPPARHYISYTNLPAGDYNLEVRYIPDGRAPQTAVISRLPIEVTPYFYNSGWFIALMILLVLGLLGLGYRLRVTSLIRQRQRLKEKIEEHTREIEHQKDLLQLRADDLAATNEQLVQRNDEILQQKEQISQMSNYVQRINLERLNFFTNITHEFRTPITLIMGPISRALKLSTNPLVIEQLNLVERNSRYLLSLVNQLMDFRRIESGKMEVMLSSGNIIDLIEETIRPFRSMAAERDITIDFLHHIIRPIISHDEDATRKVLLNFVANALKFTPEGGRITVFLALLPPEGDNPKERLYLAVSDTGPGIPADDVDKVFDKFYQGKTTIRYPSPGTTGSGIGLYLCQQIIEMYGGIICVHNNRSGAGCTFRTLFPVSACEETPAVLATHTDQGEDSAADSRMRDESVRQTILVVEDNADMRAYIKSILSSSYDILEAANGKEALATLHTQTVDFIITDLMMPVMDGSELARRVKSDFEISHIPILVLTAKTAQSSRLESYRVGVEEYLLKPFDDKILVTRIRNILDNKRRYQQQFNSGMKAEELNIETDSRDKRFMDQVMEVLKANYKNSHFDVGDFAEALGVSRTLLNNKLSSLAGQSAVTLIRSYRMAAAKELILINRTTRRYNISEIAYEVGFNDSKYFTRCFTRHFGMPPSAMLAGDS